MNPSNQRDVRPGNFPHIPNPKCARFSASLAVAAPPSTPQTPATTTPSRPFQKRQSGCTRTHPLSALPFRTLQARHPHPIQMAPAAWAVPALTAAAWALRAAVWACLAASAMLVAEAAYMGLSSLVAAAAAMLWRWRRTDTRYRWEPMPMPGAGGRVDVEVAATGADFSMVLVQIPMYNEREVRPSARVILIIDRDPLLYEGGIHPTNSRACIVD